jgi:hypothetical protein
MATATEILKRFDKAKSRKDVGWKDLYQEAQEYASPQREMFDETFKGDRKDGANRVFDSTTQDAVLTGVSNLHSGLTPAMKRWVELEAGLSIKEQPGAKEALDAVTDVLFTHLHNSNFDTQIIESYQDLFIGTGALLAFEGTRENPFNFVSVPLHQLFLEEGPNGRPDVPYRCFKLSVRNIMGQWPDAELMTEHKELLKENPDEELKFIEATLPEKVEVFDNETEEIIEVDGYKYYVVCQKTSTVIVERAMTTSPWIIFRWSNLPGEVYGRGPVLTALPAIKTLNEQVKILLQNASIATLGMYTVADDGIVNLDNIKLGGGALIPVTSNGSQLQGPTLAPLPTAGNPQLSQLIIENQQSQIKRILFGDPLGDVNLPVKTATEISLRQQDLAKRIGSAFSKLQFELIAPLINRLLSILDNLELIDLGGFKVDGTTIAIQHISPLAQAQDEEDVLKIIRFVQTIGELYGPQAAMGITEPFAFARILGDKLNIAPELVPTKEKEQLVNQALATQAAQGQIQPTDAIA